MNFQRWGIAFGTAALLALSYGSADAQDDRNRSRDQNNQRGGNQQSHDTFDDHDRQVTRDWYTQHQDHAPAGLRKQDRLSPDQESRLQPGTQLDPEMRRQTHKAPADLSRRLPPPPSNHRYVTIGGHVASVDHNNRVKDVIHLHEGENR